MLTLLAENATIVISGARIAREIGVSRSMVWQWVRQLRGLGVRVKGKAATGYFLEKVPDILTPDMLRQRLKGSLFGKHIYHFFKTDSTNRVALELGHAGEPEGTVVLAEEQTAGQRTRGTDVAFGPRGGNLRDAAFAAAACSGAGAAFDDDGGAFGARGYRSDRRD